MSSLPVRDPSQSQSQSRYIIFTEAELNKLKVEDLLKICKQREIIHVSRPRKSDIIASIMIDQTQHLSAASDRGASATGASEDAMGAASARSRSRSPSRSPRSQSTPGGQVAHRSFTKTSSSRKSPERRSASASAAAGRQSEAGDFASLTAGSIAGMSAPKAEKKRRDQWTTLCTTLGRQPWDDIILLKQGIDLRMVPENPIPVIGRRPMFVVTVAPPGSGKSTVSDILGISKDSRIDVDPDDAFNEFVVEMFGSFPPNKTDDVCTGWWETHKQEFDKYETVNLHAGRVNVRPHAPKCCIAKTYNIPTQYGTILGKEEVMDHIFDKATLGGRGTLDIVFNTTGSGMPKVIDKYIARATQLEYDIVVVGIYSTPQNCSERAAHRNTQQHRRMEPFLVSNLNTKFKHAQTIFDWEEKSRTQAYRLVLLENNGTPQNKAGAASVVFDRKANGAVDVTPRGVLTSEGGFYGMKFQDGAFVGREDVRREEAAASKATAASKRKHDGGSSRKRRISRRRIHRSRARKTIKKYSRPLTRRRRRI